MTLEQLKFKIGDSVYFSKDIKGTIESLFGEYDEITHYRIAGTCFTVEFIHDLNGV